MLSRSGTAKVLKRLQAALCQRHHLWTLATLALATAAAYGTAQAHLPLPWMLGPLFAIAALRMAGLPLHSLAGGRQAGQWAIGSALGLYFTPLVLAELVDHLGAIFLMALSAVLFGIVAARCIERYGRVDSHTAFFAALPGGASEMVVLTERYGGLPDRVAAAHALRVMLVVSVIPFVLQHDASQGTHALRSLLGPVDWAGLTMLAAASLAGVWFFQHWRIANAWVLGPLLTVGALTAAGITLHPLPGWLTNSGQLLLGVALGCHFSPVFFKTAPRCLLVSATTTLLMLGCCMLLAAALGWLVALPIPSLLLAAAPGGIAEMSITAREMHLSVPLVTATHVLRVVLLTVCAPPLCQYYLAWRRKA